MLAPLIIQRPILDCDNMAAISFIKDKVDNICNSILIFDINSRKNYMKETFLIVYMLL